MSVSAEELSRDQKRDLYESMLLQGRAISPHYREGNELIYDCELKAFVCVDETGKDLCIKQASKAKEYPEIYQTCRHFHAYESLQKCTNGQLQMIDRAMESSALGCL